MTNWGEKGLKKMASFKEIEAAKKLLGLRETASLKEIKEAFRRLSFRYHPDRSKEDNKLQNEEMMKKLNWAYRILLDYCARYKYTFTKEDWKRAYPEEAYFEKYVKGWFDDI
ncbi:MAG: J domain-containing protein [Candidatus Nealsonbacteria bacterium]|nr:MAG: J domain-containing protein [Candidatus Nealsonbacteria bacterium]